MNTHFIRFSLGKLLQLLSFFMLIPAVVALFEVPHTCFTAFFFDAKLLGFTIAIVASLCTGTILTLLPHTETDDKSIREGFAIVTFGWLLLTLFGCIPLFTYFIETTPTHSMPAIGRYFTDAFFEVMSGFTTTGATIFTDVEVLPGSLLLWRSMTHWLGGMGIVTLGLAIFPAFGVAAYQLFRGEVPGPTAERLTPSLSQTAKILWGVYALLTLIEAVLLYFGGMTPLEATCHAFGSMSTGGFSTRNASVAGFNSAYIDWVITVFMFLGGINFIVHYNLIFFRRWQILRGNHELRFYVAVILGVIVITVLALQIQGLGTTSDIMRSFRHTPLTGETAGVRMAEESAKIQTIGSSIRYAAFQVVSVITTTGFCTADYDMWPGVVRLLLVVIMFFGGCAGSTAGGIKIVRIMIVLKSTIREILSMIQPRQIIAVRIADKAIDEKLVRTILGFFATFLLCTVFFSLIMSLLIPDFTTAITSVVATMCNIGPGLSGIGPLENYAWIPAPGKWVLSLCMLLGRLELYTVLIAFAPATWRK